MFDLEICFDDIKLSSIYQEDLPEVQKWMQEQVITSSEVGWTNIDELQDRFLEYYMSENEIFLKIEKGTGIIGIFKGRVEFKNPNELLIWCFIIDSSFRGMGVGSRILKEVISFFENNYGIYTFSTGIIEGSIKALRFWNKNEFILHRVSKSFFNVKGEERDMIILKREEKLEVL
ncbi:MAG: GNAT family N-acetyltransferase [Bacillota bacterium]|nr:GNAT family N-acetyltransferase [Bacillota bacterium]